MYAPRNRLERAEVFFSGPQASYRVYIPRDATPRSIAEVLGAISLHGISSDVGQVAADFISAINPKIRVSLINAPKNDTDCRIAVQYDYYKGTTVSFYRLKGGVAQPTEFSGTYSDFLKWTKNLTGLEGIVGKVVQFHYDGGDAPGVRTIKVEKISQASHPGEAYIEGIDLAKPDIRQDSYRKYIDNKIRGDIKVLN